MNVTGRLKAGMVAAVLAIATALPLVPVPACAQAGGQWKNPQEVYQKICAYCHETGVGPHIRGVFPPKFYVKVVRHGMAAMPAFRPTDIDDAMLQKLAKWLAAPAVHPISDGGHH